MTGTVCFVMVALRIIARRFSGNKLWLDDLFQILGAVGLTKLDLCVSFAHENFI